MPSEVTTAERTVIIDAHPDVVWRVLTRSACTRLYRFHDQVTGEWAAGSTIEWLQHEGPDYVLKSRMTVTGWYDGRRLRYSHFDPDMALPDDPGNRTQVDLALEAMNDGRTSLHVYEGDFAGLPRATHFALRAGRIWVEALVSIKRLAEEMDGKLAAA